MVVTKLAELRSQLSTFFNDSAKEYFFVLSTKDLGQAGEKEKDNKFYCLCFNDGDSSDSKNYLIGFLMERKKKNGSPAATPEGQPRECRSKHIVLKFGDQKLKSAASKILVTWSEREQEHSENAPQFDEKELQLFEELAKKPPAKSFGLVLNLGEPELHDYQEPEIDICEDDVNEADVFRHNLSDEFVNEESDNQEQEDRPEQSFQPDNDRAESNVVGNRQVYHSYPSSSGEFIVKDTFGSQPKRVVNFEKSGIPQAAKRSVPQHKDCGTTARSYPMSNQVPSRNTTGLYSSSHSLNGQRAPSTVRQSSNNFGLQRNHVPSRPGPYVPQRKSMN
ncbi:uncharacterized protein LOC141850303 isoform X2 [Brevipalpus obovatus]|uniref:uncharacterized protein LOC141850303 isoform X2 n=1 Tax=Brevipalpus obovatus TaxID=246614 RepID=UPI003D9E714E